MIIKIPLIILHLEKYIFREEIFNWNIAMLSS